MLKHQDFSLLPMGVYCFCLSFPTKSLHNKQKIPFLFALQVDGVFGAVQIVHEGTIISVGDNDSLNYASITVTAIIPMEVGQRVSDNLHF